ncbi:hypothetical protein [Methylobacterium sp. NEAU K]|uniref:hypothetical protein n=1 Tax=Methylobacterium sp. NEAU K TaxID=3064946 RepID=UPI0027346520|nr:hypothetical protein [Methylobacterium sp. NEAU K]MDP4004954.1 hypothetical protein [Methylobacterium sp. NEAU K]
MAALKTLADDPFVIVQLTCDLCPRRCCYRYANLVVRVGPDADLDQPRRDLATPYPRFESAGTAMRPGCQVDYPDLRYGAQRAPDVLQSEARGGPPITRRTRVTR